MIKTDHKSLLHLFEQRILNKSQYKALLKLMDLQFKITYKQGMHNQAADALSRYPTDSSVMALASCRPVWLKRVKDSYVDSAKA